MDSAVSIAVLSKKRSSSRILNRVVKRFATLKLAWSVAATFAFVRSERNPADGPSRHRYAAKTKHC